MIWYTRGTTAYYCIDSGYQVHALISLNGKGNMHLQKVCAYKRAINSTARWYRPLTSSCMDTIVGHSPGESSLLVVRDSKS